jgi:hypothetical protein
MKRLFEFPLTIRVDVDHDHVDDLVALVHGLGEIPCDSGSAIVTGELLDRTAIRGTDEMCRAQRPVSR